MLLNLNKNKWSEGLRLKNFGEHGDANEKVVLELRRSWRAGTSIAWRRTRSPRRSCARRQAYAPLGKHEDAS